jgi:type IV secretory pathway component VirB8
MNDMTDDMLLEPPDEQFSAVRDHVFHDVIAAHQAEKYFNSERARAGWWVGGIGTAYGALATLALVAVVTAYQPQIRYTEIDDASGVIRASYGAKDAPDHFNERVVRRYLTDYVELRERFIWALDPETDHRVKLMSSPDEQRAYQAQRAKDDPATKYGMSGYGRVLKFGVFTPRAKGRDKTYEYDVQFTKGEVLASNPTAPVETKMTARVVFSFHPEISMNDQDRLHNEAGLVVMSYSSSKD